MKIAFARGGHRDTALTTIDTTFAALSKRLSQPEVGEKNGSYLIRGGSLTIAERADENLTSAELIVIDGDSSIDLTTGEITPGAPSMDIICGWLEQFGISHIAHTTHSYVPGRLEKWRVYIPATLRSKDELDACLEFIFEQLWTAGIGLNDVSENHRWSQAWYLPRVKSEADRAHFRTRTYDGDDFPVAQAVEYAALQREQAAKVAAAAEKAKPACTATAGASGGNGADGGLSPIQQFNREFGSDPAWMRAQLEANGYKFAFRQRDGSMRFVYPHSASGVPGVLVFKGKFGDWCAYSHHGEDPLADHVSDPFAIEAIFRHGGDVKAAGRAIAEMYRPRQLTAAQMSSVSTVSPATAPSADGFDDHSEDDASAGAGAGTAAEQPRAPVIPLILNQKGRPIWCVSNALSTMRFHPEWEDLLAFNEFTGRSMLLEAIPGSSQPRDDFPRDVKDGDYVAATAWFNSNGFPTATKNIIADCLELVARDAVVHPVRQYLEGLKWDGTPRLQTWLVDYFNAEINSDEHAEYITEVGLRWAISATARIFRPGCKADSAIILEGRQGCGKSSGLKALAGDDFFGDSLPPMTSKDASTYLRGLWIIELAELSNITKAEVEHIKAFVTRQEERFRPAYGRNEIVIPRQCVFAGTTNRDDYLRDDSGNRRFWPVPVGKVDVQGIINDRDQIWAEAVHRFKAGEQWHMRAEVLDAAQAEQAERQAPDVWMDRIEPWLASREFRPVSILEVATDALCIEVGRVNRADQNRIIAAMGALGWRKVGRFTGSEKHRGRGKYEKR